MLNYNEYQPGWIAIGNTATLPNDHSIAIGSSAHASYSNTTYASLFVDRNVTIRAQVTEEVAYACNWFETTEEQNSKIANQCATWYMDGVPADFVWRTNAADRAFLQRGKFDDPAFMRVYTHVQLKYVWKALRDYGLPRDMRRMVLRYCRFIANFNTTAQGRREGYVEFTK